MLKRYTSLLLALLIVILCCPTYATAAENVESESSPISKAVSFNEHRYYIFSSESVETAQSYCEFYGGHLATISSEEENSFLFSYMKSLGYSSAYFGLTDFKVEGSWEWVTGEPVVYTNWHSGEPNSESSTEDWAMFYWKFSDGTWNDGGPNTNSGGSTYICEWESNEQNVDSFYPKDKKM